MSSAGAARGRNELFTIFIFNPILLYSNGYIHYVIITELHINAFPIRFPSFSFLSHIAGHSGASGGA